MWCFNVIVKKFTASLVHFLLVLLARRQLDA